MLIALGNIIFCGIICRGICVKAHGAKLLSLVARGQQNDRYALLKLQQRRNDLRFVQIADDNALELVFRHTLGQFPEYIRILLDGIHAQTVSVLCAPPLYRAEKLNIIEIVQRRDNAGDHSAALCSKPGSDRIWGELQLIYRVLHPFCRVVPEQRPVVEISRHCRR